MLPPAILSDPPPQLPDLGPPGSALREDVVARLPPAAVATLIRGGPLGARHSIVQEGAGGGVPRKQLVVMACQRLASPAEIPPTQAGASRGAVPVLGSDMGSAYPSPSVLPEGKSRVEPYMPSHLVASGAKWTV